jgi:hypothetical protein
VAHPYGDQSLYQWSGVFAGRPPAGLGFERLVCGANLAGGRRHSIAFLDQSLARSPGRHFFSGRPNLGIAGLCWSNPALGGFRWGMGADDHSAEQECQRGGVCPQRQSVGFRRRERRHRFLAGHRRATTADFVGHENSVEAVAVSPDAKVLASGSADQQVKLWRITNGAVFRTMTGHTGVVSSVSFSPTNAIVASGSYDYTVKLWNSSNGSLLRTLLGHTSAVNSVTFSPDGDQVASGSGDTTIRLWRVSDGRLLRKLQDPTGSVFVIAYSPKNDYLASGNHRGDMALWRLADGSLLKSWPGHSNAVLSLSFSPDGAILVSGSRDSTLKYWTVPEAGLARQYDQETVVPNSLAFSPGGLLLAMARGDGTIVQAQNPLAQPAAITSLVRQGDGKYMCGLDLASVLGLACSIQTSSDLVHWTNETTLEVTNRTLTWVDPGSAAASQRFYRVRVP